MMLLNANAIRIPLADESISCCITSPPYFGLRRYSGEQSYVWGGDADCQHDWRYSERPGISGGTASKKVQIKGKDNFQILPPSTNATCNLCGAWYGCLGLENTIDQFVSNIVAVFREVWRVLHPTGQLFLNISDTRTKDRQWCGIPHRLVFALQEDGWRFEDEVVWAKTNPMPSSQTNRFTRSHEFMFMLNKSKRAFFDLDAVNEDVAPSTFPRMRRGVGKAHKNIHGAPGQTPHTMNQYRLHANNIGIEPVPPNGRARRSVWQIATQKYSGSHFSTFPEALVEPCIKAGSSEHGVCPECGCGWERVTEPTSEYKSLLDANKGLNHIENANTELAIGMRGQAGRKHGGITAQYITTGWRATCTHDLSPVPALVCDPFVGSGTVPLVARKLGRRAVGLDLSFDYLRDQAKTRLGLTALEEWEAASGKNGDGELGDLPLFAENGAGGG